MASYIQKRLYKLTQIAYFRIQSLYLRTKLKMLWEIDSGVEFRGRVNVRSCSGKVRIGKKCKFGPDVCIDCAEGAVLLIGKNVVVNQGTFIVCRDKITIGDDCLIGEYASIRDNDHNWQDASIGIRDQGFRKAEISIGKDVWIGRGAVICPGVSLGDHSVVGANAVVTKAVPACTVVAGVPAKALLKKRTTK